MVEQEIFQGKECYKNIEKILLSKNVKRYMLVCGHSTNRLPVKKYLENLNIPFTQFSSFTPNPLYESIVSGVELLKRDACDFIIAIGGGSAIDVAKCIKLYATLPNNVLFLNQVVMPNTIKLLAMPTTAGTGSESTKFAVIYYNGEKQSVYDDSIVPKYVILDSSVLKTLPLYQKKATLLDALCQAIESMWSVNSNDESDVLASAAIKLIVHYRKQYLNDATQVANEKIMLAANLAGRAINITQTTSAHAMSYKLTSIYGFAHGHAVALCLPRIWNYMLLNSDNCNDERGKEYIKSIFDRIGKLLGGDNAAEGIVEFDNILNEFGMDRPIINEKELDMLVNAVNTTRLRNNPIALDEKAIREIYCNISSKALI